MADDKKKVQSKESRRSMQDKLKAALDKKPTVASLNSQGIPAETLNKQISNVPEKTQRLIQRHVRGRNQKRFSNRPKTVQGTSITREPFKTPKVREIPTPDWFTNEEPVDVSIIVPMYRSKSVIEDQIAKWVLEDDGLTKEIIYIDDSCPERSAGAIVPAWEKRKDELNGRKVGRVLAHNRNGGFGPTCNAGASYAKGKYLIFLNADTVVHPNWVKPMHDLFVDKHVGVVGNLQLKMGTTKIDSLGSEWNWGQQSFLHIGRNVFNKKMLEKPFDLSNVPDSLMKVREVEMVTGCCFMISLRLFKEISGFDTAYRVGYWEDSDLCLKVHTHGRKILCQPESVIEHSVNHSKIGFHGNFQENQKEFRRKWIDTKIMEAYIGGRTGRIIDVPKENIVVYTAITGGYDNLKEQTPTARKDIKFIAFTDETIVSKTWTTNKASTHSKDSNRNAKIHKIMPHKFFPDHEYSLWMDGSVHIIFPFGVNRLAEIYLSENDLAIFRHPERHCLYQEANICINRRLDDSDIIHNQVQRYTKEGYPSNAGLVEATIILRRHSPEVIKFNEAWWEEIQNGSKRDQISFNYVARKLGLKWKFFPGDLRNPNTLFRVDNHKRR
jgi:GT2 family glycosyltransferase